MSSFFFNRVKRLQFSLRFLFGLTILCALTCSIVVSVLRVRSARQAEEGYSRVFAEYQVELRGPLDVCEASTKWRDTACRVPFVDDISAHRAHLRRMRKLEDQVAFHLLMSHWPRDGQVFARRKKVVLQVSQFRSQAQEALRRLQREK